MDLNLKSWRAALFAALVHAAAPALPAQESAPDPGWLAWLGCWEPADSTFREESPRALMCVIPAAGPSAVRILKVTNGVIESEERIDATGDPVIVERYDCRSRATSEWSADGMRLFLTTESECPGEEVRRGSGILSISPGGDWLDVRGPVTGASRGVSVIRYRDALPTATEVPEEIRLALDGLDEPRKTARDLMAGRLFAVGVIEAARRLDAPVVKAWLMERGLGFTVTRADLLEMERAGVPTAVIDLVVALSYPNRFAVNQGRQVERFHPRYADGFGWYGGDGPVVVVVVNPVPQPVEEHGSVVKGKGYKKGESSSPSNASETSRRTGSPSSSSESNSSSSSSSTPSTSSSERTAKPRP